MIGIIILNYNQTNYTINCVKSILKSSQNEFLLNLVDNGSSEDNYDELLKKMPQDARIRTHRLKNNVGYVGGINFGLEECSKLNVDYILILNNDTLIDSKALEYLISTCKKHKDKVIVSGKVFHFDKPKVFQEVGYKYKNKKSLQFIRIGLGETDSGQYDKISKRDMLDDVFWVFPISLYQKIGGYSTFFWFNGEQVDFALRAQKQGYNLIYTPDAKIWHKGSVSIGGRIRNPKLAYWHIQSILILGYLHLKKFNFLIFFIRILKSIVSTRLKSFYYQLKGDRTWVEYSDAKVAGLMYFLKWTIKKNENIGENPFN